MPLMTLKVQQTFPPGTIGVLCDHVSRYTDFSVSITGMTIPEGSKVTWAISADIVGNCNDLAENFHGDWLWIMGDDHVFPPDLLTNLLAHDVDVVVPLCARKNPPFPPVLYSSFIPNEGYHLLDLSQHPNGGLVEVEGAGTAGMLVKRHVIEALEKPYFRYNGLRDGVELSEDLYFCHKIREAGFKIHADLDQQLGHIRPVNVVVGRNPDLGWGRLLDFGTGDSVFLPESAMKS